MPAKPKKKNDPKRSQKIAKVPYSFKPEKMTLAEWQIALRKQFAADQNFIIENIGNHAVFSDFTVFNPKSAKTYKIAIRDENFGLNFCTCPDFKTNLLGTCKHIEYVLHSLNSKTRNKKYFKQGYQPAYSSVSLRYGSERKVFLRIGTNNSNEIKSMAKKYFDPENLLKEESFDHFEEFIEKINLLDKDFRCYEDAMEYIIRKRSENKRKQVIDNKYFSTNGNGFPADLLNTVLFPYQKEGVLFAARAGRCLIADEMGLGKTVQAIGSVELLNLEFGIEKVLIICPTSLKYQWKTEIKKFTGRDALIVEGMMLKRHEMYNHESMYKIISYNSIKNDIDVINKFAPDLIILDEAQRIKNWKTKTAQNVKSLKSEFSIVLTGTPLENRLEELHSIIQFIDMYRLGPLFSFLNGHQILDEAGKVIGYTNLHEINKTLKPVLIRRNKTEVQIQLPERIDKNYFVPVTSEQLEIHQDYYDIVCRLVNKWRRFSFLSESDRQKLLISLNCMRMVSDSTYILDQKTRYDVKIEELMIVLNEIFENQDEKIVIFSQWERMTRLVSQELDKLGIGYEYLHGGIAGKDRGKLIENFHENADTRVFLSTDAGGVGLNLQCANTIINLDIPWNPAILEQRIARVHRLGQKKHVRVINFISAGTIEERILGLLGFKKSVFEGVFDQGEDRVYLGEDRFKQFMKAVETITETVLEENENVLTNEESRNEQEVNQGAESEIVDDPAEEQLLLPEVQKPIEGQTEKTHQQAVQQKQADSLQELIGTGIDFLQKLSSALTDNSATPNAASSFIEKDENTGRSYFKIAVPDEQVLNKAVNALGEFLKAFSNK